MGKDLSRTLSVGLMHGVPTSSGCNFFRYLYVCTGTLMSLRCGALEGSVNSSPSVCIFLLLATNVIRASLFLLMYVYCFCGVVSGFVCCVLCFLFTASDGVVGVLFSGAFSLFSGWMVLCVFLLLLLERRGSSSSSLGGVDDNTSDVLSSPLGEEESCVVAVSISFPTWGRTCGVLMCCF